MKLYAIAANRWAYAGWCDRQGVKQPHAVYVLKADTLRGLNLNPDQFIFIDGWEGNRRRAEIEAAYRAATTLHNIRKAT